MSECSTSEHGNDEVENKQEYDSANENEDDDDDVDFNPLLNETHYAEVSSSLNSEVEDLDTDADDTEGKSFLSFPRNLKKNNTNIIAAGVEGGEKLMTQTNILATFTERESVSATEVEDGSMRNEDMDTEDAICMRTRARYSLTSFTLDELETFLQETDDEDDLQNIDDEAEYKKFLAAVLQRNDSRNLEGNANGDDEEDEENDADFDLELEEALESDREETEERRMTRRNRCHQASDTRSKKNSEQLNRPLRPLLPFVPIGSFSAFMENQTTLTTTQYQPPPQNGFASGFSAHQIGQLHCLIHEHVQLLIQVFAVCVLDPTKGDIAVEIKNLLLEILQKRDQVLGWRRHPFPRFCFFPPYTHPSVADDLYSHKSWVPDISGPVLSVTDVAPLRLGVNFIDDVSSAVRAYRRNQIELGLETCEKEPLFPFHNPLVFTESDGQEIITSPQDSGEVLSSPLITQISKKTMAASLIEKSKKQPVALVPKEIAQVAQRFCKIFNPALYPRKPPPAPIANRVLFTDAEDELLALGLMEYNTDWKAIQQRFLPCKSSHQIFVRQKNRVSSKAPENPIKAVRRLKNSPLTSEEIARIDVGLKNYKLDWISIWRFFVPYRDPSLLPRQWRIACGTQKSYKSDANNRAKRRLNDLRRKAKKTLSTCHSSDKEGDSTDNAVDGNYNSGIQVDKGNGAYVHEAFLVDWRSDSNAALNCSTTHLSSQKDPQPSSGSRDFQPQMSSTVLPYRARKPKYARLVKLAPDLPPINLPPSVRVMPQSDFSKSRSIPLSSAKTPCNVLRNGAPRVGSTKQPEVDQSAKSGKISEVLSDTRVAVEGSYSDFQMHPLLFESPQVGGLPYYPLESTTNTVSEKHPPRLNLSLFHNPRQIRDAVNFLSISSRPAEKHSSSSSTDIVFHPLLHDMNKESAHPSDAKFRERDSSNSSLYCPITSKPSGNSSGKVNVDLDICLNFNSNKQDGDVENRNMISHMYNDSVPRIIMEQEELSDSDDEEFGNNNNVEFEHEEMADSEEDVTSNSNTPDEEMEADEISNERCMVNEPHVLSLNLNSYPPVSPLENTNCSATPKKFDFGPFGATAGNNNNVMEHSNLQIKSRKRERASANEDISDL